MSHGRLPGEPTAPKPEGVSDAEPYSDELIERLLADSDQCRQDGITPRTFERILATLSTVPDLRRRLQAAEAELAAWAEACGVSHYSTDQVGWAKRRIDDLFMLWMGAVAAAASVLDNSVTCRLHLVDGRVIERSYPAVPAKGALIDVTMPEEGSERFRVQDVIYTESGIDIQLEGGW